MRNNRTKTIKFLTTDELGRLFNCIENKRDKAIFLIAYRHGLRASEVGLLQVNDIDFKKARIIINRLKGSYSGEHPLQSDEIKIVKSHLLSRTRESPVLFTSNRNDPIHRRTLDWLMKQYCEEAEIPQDKRHFHCLKHTIATHMLDAGADLRFVQDWLGHSQIQNTVVYTYLTSTNRIETARKVFLKLPHY